MKKYIPYFLFVAIATVPLISNAGEGVSTSAKGAKAYIISPANGELVGENVTVKFGLQGMGVSPAGLEKSNTGHHHLLIDADKLPESGKPMGKAVKHFGGGQTETTIELTKGLHTLQLVLGNHLHIPHEPPVVSEKITIEVR
ncbi:MAG: DUF4399 domain-containing protein [Gallionella sp.]